MDNEWLVAILRGGVFLALFIGLIFFITALIQNLFIWIATLKSKGVKVFLYLFLIISVSGLMFSYL